MKNRMLCEIYSEAENIYKQKYFKALVQGKKALEAKFFALMNAAHEALINEVRNG
jgi:hypothetical protein